MVTNNFSLQNYTPAEIDLEDLYNKWIKAIDYFRVDAYIDGEIDENSIQNINGKNVKKPSPPEVEAFANNATFSFKETRCNAFYRTLGLPVTDGENFFNPGYDSDKKSLPKKIIISNNFRRTDSAKTSMYRLGYLSEIINIFSIPDINSSVLALTLKNKRKFAEPISKAAKKDPTSVSIDDCYYKIPIIGANGRSMMEYKDLSLKTPDKINSKNGFGYPTFGDEGSKRFHAILPLIPDPRYDFVSGDKIVNVPFFALDPNNPDEDQEIQFLAPGIQSICILRISSADQKLDLGQNQQDAINYIKNISTIQNQSSSDKKTQNTQKELDKVDANKIAKKDYSFYFSNFISVATSLMRELKKNINIVNEVQNKYNYLPIPTSSGPEFGSAIQKIYANNDLNTEKDKLIVQLTASIALSDIEYQFNSLLTSSKKTTISSQSAIGTIIGSISDNTDEIKLLNNLLSSEKKYRDTECTNANNALKYIEYITGEFSGLGLIDVWVITSALYLIDIGVLVSLLDEKAYDRMSDGRFNIGYPPTKTHLINGALKELSNQILDLYTLCDSIYDSI